MCGIGLPMLAVSFALAFISIRISLRCARVVWLGLTSAFAAADVRLASRQVDAIADFAPTDRWVVLQALSFLGSLA